MSFSSINYNNNNNNNNVISCIDELTIPAKTIDPFLFCVYHKDIYPAGDKKMYAPRRGNGHDFDSSKSYRMYHGDRIPGFPQHPHRGFETVTATLEGLVDHTDSLGNGGRYGQGDLQWMTAGRGVVHGEMFALVNDKEPNPTRLFQIWLNLPRKSKMVPPAFAMHWHENIPKIIAEDGKTTLTLWAGTFGDQIGLPPPPDSYGTDPNSELGIYFLQIPPGGSIDIPPTKSAETKRMAYFVEGSSVLINNVEYTHHCIFTLKSTELVTFQNSNSSDKLTEILILQGKPLNEPVAQHGPFVMNTRAEIQQAFEDYRTTGFGGWPWPEDAMVFPRDKGRFALMNGKEERPQSLTRTNQDEL